MKTESHRGKQKANLRVENLRGREKTNHFNGMRTYSAEGKHEALPKHMPDK